MTASVGRTREDLAPGISCLMVGVSISMRFKGLMLGKRYVKEVDAPEKTIESYQEIYDENGRLIEIHVKYPVDKGHIRVKRGKL